MSKWVARWSEQTVVVLGLGARGWIEDAKQHIRLCTLDLSEVDGPFKMLNYLQLDAKPCRPAERQSACHALLGLLLEFAAGHTCGCVGAQV